ncbi:hypothetical protein D8674_035007 [Pyrus ussuriensis x Pyrus communis]|uniref:MULE transposase domain-containing protein n=1 Tax=Pyrus ussuriensis x Pyrus communis TaxID=2448454 RepID=A0A5N5GFV0_9ROSA|nr:hypothetical protein D8674_035007 [Pyrus ussuriensis x Pyrus communis]
MENGKLTRFTYGGLCVVSSISSTSTLNQICIDLCSRFKGLRVGYPNCVLDCDVDVLNMLMVLDVVRKSILEILVMDKCDGSMVQLPIESTSSCCTSDTMIAASENDHLGKYGSHGMIVFELNGDDVDAYKLLPLYVEFVRSSNLGSVVELEVVSESNGFLRLFIAYDAWIKGFMFCRPRLFIDGTFVMSKYKGTFLSCCAKNGNDEFFPECPHSFCIVHLKQNMSTLFPKAASEGLKKKMMNLLANCAYACTPSNFDDCMAEFKNNGQGHVKNFLCDLPKKNYVIAHFPNVRVRFMGSMAEKRIFGQNIHTILCPKKENEMKLMLKEGMHWRISRSNADGFEKTYQFVMHPFSNLEKPNVDTIINGVRPPITKILSRRPKKTRIKSAREISGSKKAITCSKCGCSEHNKVSCKVVIQDG